LTVFFVCFRELDRPNISVKSKYGAYQISLPGRPFITGSLKDSAIIGKMFIVRLLEVMQANNYDFLFSSDLARMWDQSSLFFRKSSDMAPERAVKRVVCIAPGSTDKLILMNHSQQITDTVRESIKSAWTRGIQTEGQEVHGKFALHEFKLNGTPWLSEQDQSVGCRKLLLEIITRMASIGFRLHANVNIKVTIIKYNVTKYGSLKCLYASTFAIVLREAPTRCSSYSLMRLTVGGLSLA
jgi:hypothetical protein